MSRFDIVGEVLECRLSRPTLFREIIVKRERPGDWSNRRLVIVAADHPARGAVAAEGQPLALGRRGELLKRLATVLMQPCVDGVLASPDVMEELLLMNHVVVERGGPDFMQGKVLVGSMNRGGVQASAWETDDFVTGYTAPALQKFRLDAGKLLLKVDFNDPRSGKTLQYCAEALGALGVAGIPAFVEPLTTTMDLASLVRLVGIASGLGTTSQQRWLKLPMIQDFGPLLEATTCPVLLLGGSQPGTPEDLARQIRRCRAAGPQVRGVMIGRGLLYPKDQTDPASAVWTVAEALHDEGNPREVVRWPGL